ncbi:MAG: TolC family protein [Pseudobdellovibrio sp.]
MDKKLDLLSLTKKSEAQHYNYQALNKHWIPKVSVFADYNWYNNRNDSFSDRDAFRESYLIGANLTWNLFDGFGSYARSSQAEAQALQIEKTVQISKLKSQNDLNFWKRKFTYYNSLYKSKTSDIERSNEAVRLAKAGRKAGVRTNTELLDAQAGVYRSKAAQISAQIGEVEALINIELATGKQLYSFARAQE